MQRTLSRLRWHCRHAYRQLHKHRRKVVTAGLLYGALLVFGVDFIISAFPFPHWLLATFEAQRPWAVPLTAFSAHIGFLMERMPPR